MFIPACKTKASQRSHSRLKPPNSNQATLLKAMSTCKVVLITGGGRGIGVETARLFAANGFSICINYISDLNSAEQVKEEVLDFGVQCITVKADVSDENEVIQLYERIDDEFGALSVLVNNVGVLSKQSRLENISAQRFLDILNTNVMSCFLCSKEAVKRMSTKHGGVGGAIVNVSSGAAKTGSPNEYADYAASKGAMDTLTRGLAIEMASEGIRVNVVRPSLIDTEMHASGGEPNRVDRLKTRLPLQRGGKPSEVAEAILWLATEKSSFVTGSFIDTTGGL